MNPKNDTVLILGAGASCPYSFPTATGLREMIIGSLPHAFRDQKHFPAPAGYYSWAQFIEKSLPPGLGVEDLHAFQREFRESQVYSIDRFVYYRREFENIAKYYISFILLFCESVKKLDGDWYQQLWNELILSHSHTDQVLEIVTFNYDRSLERYLQLASKACFGDDSSILRRVNIRHVYGHLGSLVEDSAVEYGNYKLANRAATTINLIPPRAEAQHDLQQTITQSRKVIFLGFGFDELNLQVLGINKRNAPPVIYATRNGLSASAEGRARDFMPNINWAIAGQNARDFLHEFNILKA